MKDLPRHLVGATVMLIAALLIVGLFFAEIPEGNRDIAMVLLGIAMGWGGAVVQFHFGSSEGSKEKTNMLATRPTGEASDPVHVEEEQ